MWAPRRQEWWDTLENKLSVVRDGSEQMLECLYKKRSDSQPEKQLSEEEAGYTGEPRVMSYDKIKKGLHSFLMDKTTGEARNRVKASDGDGVVALRKIITWYKGVSDATRELNYQLDMNPERVKKESEMLSVDVGHGVH